MLNKKERARLDCVTANLHQLLKGRIPDSIDVNDYPDDEIKQLSDKTNELVHAVAAARDFIIPLSEGVLDVEFYDNA